MCWYVITVKKLFSTPARRKFLKVELSVREFERWLLSTIIYGWADTGERTVDLRRLVGKAHRRTVEIRT